MRLSRYRAYEDGTFIAYYYIEHLYRTMVLREKTDIVVYLSKIRLARGAFYQKFCKKRYSVVMKIGGGI